MAGGRSSIETISKSAMGTEHGSKSGPIPYNIRRMVSESLSREDDLERNDENFSGLDRLSKSVSASMRDEEEEGALSDVSSGTLSEPEAGEIKSDEDLRSEVSNESLGSVESARSLSYSPHTPPLPPKAYEPFTLHSDTFKRKASSSLLPDDDEERRYRKKKKKDYQKS